MGEEPRAEFLKLEIINILGCISLVGRRLCILLEDV